MQRMFTKCFRAGLAVAIPLCVTFGVLAYLLISVDGWFRWSLPERAQLPGVGVVLAVVLVAAVGAFAGASLTASYVGGVERFLLRVPGVKLLYGAIKDFSDALVGKTKRFDKPVLVQLGGGLDAGVIGFVTRDNLESLGMAGKVAVYFPQSYNFGGNLLILPRERVIAIDVDSARVMTFVMSGGVADTSDGHDFATAERRGRTAGLRAGAARWNSR
ncbi:MAG: DUF502 domain-containing protein [Planctomycetes bacterium]|nr:DUF502 domain-containing protein [Planctomycetota bacterium]